MYVYKFCLTVANTRIQIMYYIICIVIYVHINALYCNLYINHQVQAGIQTEVGFMTE